MGRAAADVPFATLIGAAILKKKAVTAQELTDEIPQVPAEEPAISTA